MSPMLRSWFPVWVSHVKTKALRLLLHLLALCSSWLAHMENELRFPHSHTTAHTKRTPFPNLCPPVWALQGSLSFLTPTRTQGLLYQGRRRGAAEMERKKLPRSQGKHQQLRYVCVCMYTAVERHGSLVLKPGCAVLKRPFLRNTDESKWDNDPSDGKVLLWGWSFGTVAL